MAARYRECTAFRFAQFGMRVVSLILDTIYRPNIVNIPIAVARDRNPFSSYSSAIGTSSALLGCNMTSAGTPYHRRLTGG